MTCSIVNLLKLTMALKLFLHMNRLSWTSEFMFSSEKVVEIRIS